MNWPDPGVCEYLYKRDGDHSHRYMKTPDGVFPGVTTILKIDGTKTEALIKWAVKQAKAGMDPQAVKEKAGDIGSMIHDAVEARIRTFMGVRVPEPVLTDPNALAGFQAWQQWWQASDYKPVRMEQPVWDAKMGYAGTLDFLVECPRRGLGIVDWKTGKGIYDSYHLQVAAYMRAARNWVPVEWAEIVRLPKTPGDAAFTVRALGDLECWDFEKHETYITHVTEGELFQAFTGLKMAWDVMVGRKLK